MAHRLGTTKHAAGRCRRRADERTLDRQVADAVMEDIIAWRIPPGSWIRERQIAQRFNVSHGPVREAFRHLSQAGFINVVPWRGAHVIEMTPHTVHEIYTLWSSLFSVICRLAAERIGDEDLPRLEELVTDYEKCARDQRHQ
jgi:DNA-binding GntR family transcriptional regulator